MAVSPHLRPVPIKSYGHFGIDRAPFLTHRPGWPKGATTMSTNESDHSHEVEVRPRRSHMVVAGLLTVGLVAALAGDAYLWVRSTHLNDQIAQNQADEQTQISALKEATTTLLQQ